jgi:multicomponent Na+:H+ antiporter subunit D
MFFVLILATAGIPPFLGFWPKLLLLQGLIAGGDWVAVFALLLGSFLTLIAGIRLWSRLFWRQPAVAAGPAPSVAPIALLTGAVLLLGLWPSLMLNVASAAATDLLNPARYIAAVGLSP